MIDAPSQARPTDPELFKLIRRKFEEEEADPDWAPDASTAVHRQLTKSLPNGARLNSQHCGKTMCWSEATYPDLSGYQEHMKAVLTDPSPDWKGAIMATLLSTDANGSVSTEAYFVRRGEDPTAQVLAEAFPE